MSTHSNAEPAHGAYEVTDVNGNAFKGPAQTPNMGRRQSQPHKDHGTHVVDRTPHLVDRAPHAHYLQLPRAR